jgi:hypothetical protein
VEHTRGTHLCKTHAESSLGDAKSSLGDAESSLSDAKSSLGDIQAASERGTTSAHAGVLGFVVGSYLRRS